MLTFAFGVFCGWLSAILSWAWLVHHSRPVPRRAEPLPFWDEVPEDIQEWMDGQREHLTPRTK